jgi:hypothetical protein
VTKAIIAFRVWDMADRPSDWAMVDDTSPCKIAFDGARAGTQSWQQSSQASTKLRVGLLDVFLVLGLACLLDDVVIRDLI